MTYENIDGAEIAWNAFEPNHTVVYHKDKALGTYQIKGGTKNLQANILQ